MKQNRLKSAAAWVTTGAALITVLSAFGVITPVQGDALNTVVVAVCGALTVFGIFNNPTDQKKF